MSFLVLAIVPVLYPKNTIEPHTHQEKIIVELANPLAAQQRTTATLVF